MRGRRRKREVPELPPELAEIIGVASMPSDPGVRLSDLVAREPAFSASVLKRVNRSFRSPGGPLSSIHRAVAHLGAQGLRNLALTVAAMGGVSPEELYPFDLDRYWEDSLRRAAAAELLAEEEVFGAYRPDLAFTAGLLQDLPVLVLIRLEPAKADIWMSFAAQQPEQRRRRERRLFGRSHDDLATDLVEKWSLGLDIGMPMIHHHRPEHAPEEFRSKCQLHELAEAFAAVFGTDEPDKAWAHLHKLAQPVFGEEETSAARVDAILDKIGTRVVDAARTIGVSVAEQPSVARLRRRAERAAEMADLGRQDLVARIQHLLTRNEALQRELAQSRTLIDSLSETDDLTGLPNDKAITAHLSREVRRAARSGGGLALIELVIQAKKDIETVEVQQVVAVAVGATMRNTDLVARVEDCRFALLLPDTSPEGAFVAARRALVAVERHFDGESPTSAQEGWSLHCGIAGLTGRPTVRPNLDAIAQVLRQRARQHAVGAAEQSKTMIRTGLEIVPWG